jgi:dipeptidyl aminopeptidase/acylaminoacyl peptidase
VPDALADRSQSTVSVDDIDLSKPLYFSTTTEDRIKNGLARRRAGAAEIDVLLQKEARLSCLKAADAEVYACASVTVLQPEDYFVLGKDGQLGARLTDANPAEREHSRWAGAKYLTFTTARGYVLNGTLFLPVGYIPGKTYPAIVNIYEEGMASRHNYLQPNSAYVGRWLRKGYAVLKPDIRLCFNDSGSAAVEAMTAAVEAALATGVVDRERLGLFGHSFGGYETYYLASHTTLFKAAVPESGLTNLWSHYGNVREIAGRPSSTGLEGEQPYMKGPWWEHWDAYLRNSPLFYAPSMSTPLLMVHGDQDEAAPFGQAVEMFNTLRRMGNQQAVLLQYAGERHTFSKPVQRDIWRRMEQFFDHFLQGPGRGF